MNSFCTIITAEYIPYALALHQSLSTFGDDVQLHVLVTDPPDGFKDKIETNHPGIFILNKEELCNSGIGKALFDKYYHSNIHVFRWCIKPVLIRYLLQEKKYQKVIYTDADIRFYSDYHFLLEDLDTCNVLLTPHWRSSDPHADLPNFEILYTSGLYNGGFTGANQIGVAALEWWAMACEFICIKDTSKGMFYDQTHLNLLPIYFDKIGIVKHRGCNVANWNMVECKRSLSEDGQSILIAGQYPIVFIHFSKSTIDGIVSGVDPLLRPYLHEYYNAVNLYSNQEELQKLSIPESLQGIAGNQKINWKKKIKSTLKKMMR
jgi:hypothetical protein